MTNSSTPLPAQSEIAKSVGLLPEENAATKRYRIALEQIEEKYRRSSDAWRPNRDTTKFATDWHDGFHTALASMSMIAGRALDPENYERSDEMQRVASQGTDREWFDLTGCCGHCGSMGHDCVCTDDDPCACGPHEPRTWPIPCYACSGSGVQEPRKPKVRREVPDLFNGASA